METVSKHTPGPWWVSNTGTRVSANIPGVTTNWIIAECRIPEPVMGGIETFPSAANAKLIAAAPELLEACHGVDVLYSEMQAALPSVVGTKSFDLITDAVRKARAAIKKATS